MSSPVDRIKSVLGAVVLASLTACGEGSSGLNGFGTVILQFDNVVDGAPLVLNSTSYTNAAGNVYTVSKLEYVLSDFTLGGASTHSVEGQYYRDAGDPSTAAVAIVDVPAGTYSSLSFVHGVPATVNVAGALPDLDAAGMAWPAMVGGGYHYMRNEGAFTPTGGGTANFTTHTGPSMGGDYTVEVSLTLPSTIELDDGESYTITLEMDVNEWYTDPNDWDFNSYGLIMGNTAAQADLQENGASVWSAAAVN